MNSEILAAEYLRHNIWATDQVLALCEKLDPHELDTTAPGSYGTIRDTIQHMVRADVSYTRRLGGRYVEPPFKWDDKPEIAQVRAYATQVGDALVEVVLQGKPDDLVREEENGNWVEYLAVGLWLQSVLHGVEHRTNITTILEQLNRRPPEIELDAWGYMFTHQDEFRWKEGTTNE
jgi:uncharacterized damage-inducible protein DinB